MSDKRWVDIPDFEGLYQISNYGDVRSLDRTVGGIHGENSRTLKGRVIRLIMGNCGYYKVGLSKHGKCTPYHVHKLVAMCFNGHSPNGFTVIVDHEDNDKLNNYYKNLKETTVRDNTSKDRTGGTSKYAGVYWEAGRANKWRVKILLHKTRISLGSYVKEEDARDTYLLALSKYESDTEYFKEEVSKLKPVEIRNYLL